MFWPRFWLSLVITIVLSACRSQPASLSPEFSGIRFVTVTPSPTVVPSALGQQAMPAIVQPALPDSPTLSDVAAQVGLNFTHGAFQTSLAEDPIAMMGGGLCWIDIDNDGWLDLYVVNSYALHEIPFWEAQGGLPRNSLFRNEGDGTFTDISAASRTNLAIRGNGCVAADFDRDGWWDLYVTAAGPNALLWNNGDGTFTEAAAVAGLAAPEWNSAAVVGDLNRDGWPDLFVGAYLDLENKIPNPSGAFPQDFYGLPDRLYLNSGPSHTPGRVTFREVSQTAGLTKAERALGALFSDVDQDGDLDLYITNDGHPNRLYINQPAVDDSAGLGFRLVDMTAAADVGDSGSGMGISGGDYDGDGRVDLLVTNWQTELNALYRNETDQPDQPVFQYSTYRIGLSGLGNEKTGWGTAWLDLDHDTDLDLLVANGKVPITDLQRDRQWVRLYRNRSHSSSGARERPGQFIEWTEQVGLNDVGPLMARGSAVADYDNDGDLDVAINSIGGALVLLQNSGPPGNWLEVSVDGFYPGLVVKTELPGGQRLVREIYAGSSYLASEDPRLHFGLGPVKKVGRLEVYWPDGHVEDWTDVPANQIWRLASDEEKIMPSKQCRTLNIAHRGARSLAPENTLAAARKGFEAGADMWELDVALTANGVPILIHDDTLERTSNVREIFPERRPWRVHEFTLAEVRQLDFGSWFLAADPFGQIAAGLVSPTDLEDYRGEPAPTLREALTFSRRHDWPVNVEIKDLSGTPGDITVIEKVVALVEELDMVDQVIISSFNHPYLEQVKALNTTVATGVLARTPTSDPVSLLNRLNAQAYHPRKSAIVPEDIPRLRAQGFDVNVYTVNDEATMKSFIEAQASGIFTDYPQLLNSVLESCR